MKKPWLWSHSCRVWRRDPRPVLGSQKKSQRGFPLARRQRGVAGDTQDTGGRFAQILIRGRRLSHGPCADRREREEDAKLGMELPQPSQGSSPSRDPHRL